MPIGNVYDIGDNVDLQYSYINASGALVNATAISGYVVKPSGASVAIVPTLVATGSYEANTGTFDLAGRWLARIVASGVVNDSETLSIIVRRNAPVRADDAYATIDDVLRYARGRTFTASSPVSISDVQDHLNFSKGEIDGLLRRVGYSLPVATTATSALALLANGNAMGAACAVETSAPIANRSSTVCKLYADFKKMVLAGDLELDAPKDEGNSSPRSNAANQATGFFTREFYGTTAQDW
jgi:hypothetical protein